jgi:hypothetical protein
LLTPLYIGADSKDLDGGSCNVSDTRSEGDDHMMMMRRRRWRRKNMIIIIVQFIACLLLNNLKANCKLSTKKRRKQMKHTKNRTRQLLLLRQ